MAKLSDTASGDSRRKSRTARRWKRGVDISVTLEIIERLATVPATPQRLAGSRAEFRQNFSVFGTALRAPHQLHAEQRAAGACGKGRCDAVFLQLAPAVFAHPIRGPGRRQNGTDLRIEKSLALQRQIDFKLDHVHRRTT